MVDIVKGGSTVYLWIENKSNLEDSRDAVLTFSSWAHHILQDNHCCKMGSSLPQCVWYQSPRVVVWMELFNRGLWRMRISAISTDCQQCGRSTQGCCCQVEHSSWRVHITGIGDRSGYKVENFCALEVGTCRIVSRRWTETWYLSNTHHRIFRLKILYCKSA